MPCRAERIRVEGPWWKMLTRIARVRVLGRISAEDRSYIPFAFPLTWSSFLLLFVSS